MIPITKHKVDESLRKVLLLLGVLFIFMIGAVAMQSLEHFVYKKQAVIKEKRNIKREAEEVYHLSSIINAECGNCSLAEKRMIGSVVINRARYGGQSILGVISEESQFHGYRQEGYICTEENSQIAERLLSGKRERSVLYFFTGVPEWSDSLTIVKKKGFIHTFAY